MVQKSEIMVYYCATSCNIYFLSWCDLWLNLPHDSNTTFGNWNFVLNITHYYWTVPVSLIRYLCVCLFDEIWGGSCCCLHNIVYMKVERKCQNQQFCRSIISWNQCCFSLKILSYGLYYYFMMKWKLYLSSLHDSVQDNNNNNDDNNFHSWVNETWEESLWVA